MRGFRSSALLSLVGFAFSAVLVRAQAPYELGSGDVIAVEVLGQEEMTGEFTVDEEGMLPFPILGRIRAAQMTAPELQRKLTTLLADGYVKRPSVRVTVKEYQSHRVFVTGEVQRPGAYTLRGDRSMLILLSDIGDLSPRMGHEIVVIRPPAASETDSSVPEASTPEPSEEDLGGEGEDADAAEDDGAEGEPDTRVARGAWHRLPNEVPGSQIFRINFTELVSGNPARNMILMPGDTVYFPPAAKVYVTGHVVRPGPYQFQEGMSVFQALTLAGGLTSRGSKKIKVIRLIDGEQEETRVEMTDLVQPEDTIVVPERFF